MQREYACVCASRESACSNTNSIMGSCICSLPFKLLLVRFDCNSWATFPRRWLASLQCVPNFVEGSSVSIAHCLLWLHWLEVKLKQPWVHKSNHLGLQQSQKLPYQSASATLEEWRGMGARPEKSESEASALARPEEASAFSTSFDLCECEVPERSSHQSQRIEDAMNCSPSSVVFALGLALCFTKICLWWVPNQSPIISCECEVPPEVKSPITGKVGAKNFQQIQSPLPLA